MSLNILVIGGNGFIGSHLVDALQRDHQVTVFGRSPNKFIGEHEKVEYIYGDFNNSKLLDKAIKNKNLVYHLLSTTVPITGNMDPVFDIQSNLVGTINLLHKIGQSDVERLVYTSSGGTVYGNPEYLPIDENHSCNPISSYGIVKYTIENYIKMYAKKFDFTYLITRPSNPFGPRQNFKGSQGLIAKLLYHGLTGEDFTIWGDGSSIRDYIFINDLVELLKIGGLSKNSGIFNVGSGRGKSINEIVELLSQIMEDLPPIKYVEKNGTFVEKVVLDINATKEIFFWEPMVSMEEGLNIHNEWMKSTLKT